MRKFYMRLNAFNVVLAVFATAMISFTGAVWGGGDHAGGHGHDKGHDHHDMAMMGGKPGSPSKIDRTIVIEAKDMEFGVKSISVKEGETVKFIVKNSGEVEHDFTIGTSELQKSHRAEMTKMMRQMAGHDHRNTAMKHDDPNAIFLLPGEQKELIWTFAKTDDLEFGCNIPGHYEAGMKGRFRFDVPGS